MSSLVSTSPLDIELLASPLVRELLDSPDRLVVRFLMTNACLLPVFCCSGMFSGVPGADGMFSGVPGTDGTWYPELEMPDSSEVADNIPQSRTLEKELVDERDVVPSEILLPVNNCLLLYIRLTRHD